MKKLLLASAVAALSVSAQAAPTVYGKVFLSTDYTSYDSMTGTLVTNTYAGSSTPSSTTNQTSYKYDKQNDTKLNSNASRIGIKGSEKLTENTDILYQLEYRVEVDDNSSQFTSRDTYLGLKNAKFGTALAGRLSAIDDMIDYADVTEGGVVDRDDLLVTFNEPRANNAFAYVSPSYNGLNILAMYAIDSDQDSDSNVTYAHDMYGIGAKYEPAGKPFKAGITYITAGDALKATRVSGSFDVNPAITVGALYQNTDFNLSEKENGFTLSGTYKLPNKWTAYAQADLVQNVAGVKDVEKQRLVVGGKYSFNKATTGHVYGGFLKNKNETVTVTNTLNSSNVGTVSTITGDRDAFSVGAGLEYKF